jgi:hypothetical protein
MSNQKSTISQLIYYLGGILFTLIGIINTFWGNDTWFGVLILVNSLFFYPPLHRFLMSGYNIKIPVILLIALALFMLWASLGVGELFAKIELMRASF